MTDPVRLAAVLDAPADWTQESGSGYVLHREPQADIRLAFAESVARGLEDHPRTLSCTYLYDEEGSRIFEAITRQPEYYQTRTEDAILEAAASQLRLQAGNTTVVELGSGSSSKTRNILDAWCRRGPTRYVPIDVSGAALDAACRDLTGRFPTLTVEALATTYERGIPLAARMSPLLLIFLGSTIGNFTHGELDAFLDLLAGHLRPEDRLLIGIDLIKSTARLESAYNDAAGWSERFTLNLFARMNRELDTHIPLDAIEHVAYFNEALARIEIYARFRREVDIEIPLLGRGFRMAPGEMVLTEISRKFEVDDFAAHLNRFGFSLEEAWSDAENLFSVLLFRRRRENPYADNRRRSRIRALQRMRSETLDILAPVAGAVNQDRPALHEALISRLWDLAAHESHWLMSLRAPQVDRSGLNEASPPPTLDEVLLHIAAVRRQLLRDMAAPGNLATPPAAPGVPRPYNPRREALLHETLLEDIQELGDHDYEPVHEGAPPARPDQISTGEMLLIPDGPFRMGQPAEHDAEENEQPQHEARVPSFMLDAAPVTNREYLSFMEDGGYENPEFWNDDGWRFRCSQGLAAPAGWVQDSGVWTIRHLSTSSTLDPFRPVCLVSWFEAEAFARWCGKRLPGEAEWEKAATWDPVRRLASPYPWGSLPPQADLANLDHDLWEPMPVGSYPQGRSFYGCHQMLGDVWEWTAGTYQPYPRHGSTPFGGDSNSVWGDHLRVLRGGSWATSAPAITCHTRRAALPSARNLFAGFRCARNL
ncbi:MAG: L-histidine N(alpha)-methyltransferase [Acidobacteria bacterium]|nr:MAG: L-histidine N(alpha)-methyltransferase [Acidobacteriota bacterium]